MNVLDPPKIDIDGNIVVYTKISYDNNYNLLDSAIYWKNLTNSAGGRVSSYFGSLQINPAVSGTRVVWQDNREGSWVIYWKDLTLGTGGRASNYTGPNLKQEHPSISGNKIVWTDNREGTPVIYWKTPTTGNTHEHPPTPDPTYSKEAPPSQIIK